MHLEFCAMLCRLQHQVGRYFVHTHLRSTTSWYERTVAESCAASDGYWQLRRVNVDLGSWPRALWAKARPSSPGESKQTMPRLLCTNATTELYRNPPQAAPLTSGRPFRVICDALHNSHRLISENMVAQWPSHNGIAKAMPFSNTMSKAPTPKKLSSSACNKHQKRKASSITPWIGWRRLVVARISAQSIWSDESFGNNHDTNIARL